MRLQIILAFALTGVVFSGASFASSGGGSGSVHSNTLNRVSSKLHTVDHKANTVEVLKNNSE